MSSQAKDDETSNSQLSNASNVIVLERKIYQLERQLHDIKDHVIEGERKAAVEKRRKIESKFKQKFRQQKLPAWQPILTADTVLPAFFLIGLLFIPLGAALLYFSNNVQEKVIDYTDCRSVGPKYKGELCQDVFGGGSYVPKFPCICEIDFSLEKTFKKNVYMYYGLENFYQNHRRYVKSRDDRQLYGQNSGDVNSNCEPFARDESGKPFAPCGAIANSMFNDSMKIVEKKKDGSEAEVQVFKTEIAWPSDKKLKFKNPPGELDPTSSNFAFVNTSKPKYWFNPVYQLDPELASNNGYENEDLIVWMRTAAFPTFRKLYRRVDHTKGGYINGMPSGNYTLRVEYNYPVKSFGGRKKFIISTTSFLGGKNDFLGIAYVAVGALCLLLGVIFLVVHIKFGKRQSDLLQSIPVPTTPSTSNAI